MAKKSLIKLVTGSYDEEPKEQEEEIEVPSSESPREEWMEQEGQLTIDVYQTGDEMVIKSTIAGVSSDELDITITNDMVTIKGERQKDEDVHADDYYYQELYWGAFSRSVILPAEIDTENAKAALKDGVLTIRLPKIERIRTKKLKIQGS